MLAQLPAAPPPHLTGLLVLTAGWLAVTVFWLWTLRDCLVSGRVERREKLVWTVVLLVTYVFGAVPYLFAVRLRRPPAKTSPS